MFQLQVYVHVPNFKRNEWHGRTGTGPSLDRQGHFLGRNFRLILTTISGIHGYTSE